MSKRVYIKTKALKEEIAKFSTIELGKEKFKWSVDQLQQDNTEFAVGMESEAPAPQMGNDCPYYYREQYNKAARKFLINAAISFREGVSPMFDVLIERTLKSYK